jgi:hypothetical protein
MMGGGAFGPLKAGPMGPENAKQAEMPVAGLWKILCTSAASAEGTFTGCIDEISAGHG